jgi:small subunit ribosomal protein S13
MEEQKVQKIVRLLETDIDGNIKTYMALKRIKGVGFMVSNALCLVANVDRNKKIGLLTKEEVSKIEQTLRNAEKNFPVWMLNRRRDPETGENMHVFGTSIDLKKREDINKLRKIRAYRGIRHELHLPVRGQRTRGSFRVNKTVGVSKKKALAAKSGKK